MLRIIPLASLFITGGATVLSFNYNLLIELDAIKLVLIAFSVGFLMVAPIFICSVIGCVSATEDSSKYEPGGTFEAVITVSTFIIVGIDFLSYLKQWPAELLMLILFFACYIVLPLLSIPVSRFVTQEIREAKALVEKS